MFWQLWEGLYYYQQRNAIQDQINGFENIWNKTTKQQMTFSCECRYWENNASINLEHYALFIRNDLIWKMYMILTLQTGCRCKMKQMLCLIFYIRLITMYWYDYCFIYMAQSLYRLYRLVIPVQSRVEVLTVK